MSQHTIVATRSVRHPRSSRMRSGFYLPLVLFVTSIVGGLAVMAAELPAPVL